MPKKKKVSPKDFAALNSEILGIRYPADQERTQLRARKLLFPRTPPPSREGSE